MTEKIQPRNSPETFERIKARLGEQDLKGVKKAPVLSNTRKKRLIEYLRHQDQFRARSVSNNWMKVII